MPTNVINNVVDLCYIGGCLIEGENCPYMGGQLPIAPNIYGNCLPM